MKLTSALVALSVLFESSEACSGHLLSRAIRSAAPEDCPGSAAPSRIPTVIKNVRVYNGKTFSKPENVLISEDKIAATTGFYPLNSHVVDGTSKFLIPGLIDSHVHPQDCAALAELAGYGVTTAINMNCLDYESCRTLRKQSGLSDFISAGLFAVGSGTPLAHQFHVPDDQTIKPDTDLVAQVNYTFGNGSDFYKIVAEDGGPTLLQQKEIIELVRGHGSFTATHASLVEFFEQAIESKTECIQHSPIDGILSGTSIGKLRAQKQFVTPTMEFYRTIFVNPVFMHKAGIPLAVGTDAIGAVPGVMTYPFGSSLHCELLNFKDAGFRNADILNAATSVPASLHRLKDRGVIEAGKRADLVLLNSNPLDCMSNALDISAVWGGGVRVASIKAQKGQTCS